MLETTITQFNLNPDLYAAQCIETHEVLKVKREKGENFIVVGEKDWSAIEETLYLNRIPGLVESIRKAAEEPLSEGTPIEGLDGYCRYIFTM